MIERFDAGTYDPFSQFASVNFLSTRFIAQDKQNFMVTSWTPTFQDGALSSTVKELTIASYR